MKKIKEFMKPVKGGWFDGLKFWSFMWEMERIPLILVFILANIIVVTFDSTVTKGVSIGLTVALESIATLILFKSLQHWNDLKNHTSR